jgi:hypothetical protein
VYYHTNGVSRKEKKTERNFDNRESLRERQRGKSQTLIFLLVFEKLFDVMQFFFFSLYELINIYVCAINLWSKTRETTKR